jgi:hypothetical protein
VVWPISAATLTLLGYNLLQRVFATKHAKLILFIFVAVVLSNKVFVHVKWRELELQAWQDFGETIQELQKLPKEAVIAVVTHSYPFQDILQPKFSVRLTPTMIHGLTGIHLFSQDWFISPEVSPEENIAREMGIGLIFSDKPKLVWPCIEQPEFLPGDIFSCTWSYYILNRIRDCRLTKSIRSQISACSILKDFQLNYILVESELGLSLSAEIEKLSTLQFTSQGEKYRLYEFNQLAGIKYFCSGS